MKQRYNDVTNRAYAQWLIDEGAKLERFFEEIKETQVYKQPQLDFIKGLAFDGLKAAFFSQLES